MLRKQFTILSLFALASIGNLFGQSATLLISDESANPGETVCLPITVLDFSDVTEFGFTLNWDDERLIYQGVQNINPALVGLNTINVFPPAPGLEGINEAASAAGGLTAYWRQWDDGQTCEMLATGTDLPDGAILFEVCFQLVGSGYGEINPVRFFNSPQPLVLNKKLGDGSCTEDAILGTDEDEGGSITEGVDPLIMTTSVPPGNYQPGDLVCVDIVVESGFVNMQGLQFGLDWDRDVLEIESVIPNEDIPNNAPFIYNVNAAENCFGTSWSFTIDPGVTLDPNTVFASACFRITGNCGDQTNIEIGANSCNGAQIEATNSTIQTLAVVTNSDRLRINNCNNFGLDVVVNCPGPVNVGDNICVEVQAGDNYIDINSYNYLLRFDENILQFTGVSSPIFTITNSDFDDDNVDNGILGVDVNHTPSPQVDAAPGELIYEVCFDVINFAPTTPITISDPSTVDEDNPDLVLIGVDPSNCEIDIVQPAQVIMSFGDVEAGTSAESCLPVTVNNFNGITDLRFTLQYDVSGGDNFVFTSINNEALTGATLTDLPGSGLILYEYSGPPVTLPDGATLFNVCIQAVDGATPNTCSPVDIVGLPFTPVATNGDGTIDGIVSNAGEACVLFPEGFGLIIGNATTGISSTVCLPVQVVSFDNITGANFDIGFDPAILEYNGISISGWPGLTISDVDESQAGIGVITIDWNDPTGGGVAVADSTVMFEICFNVQNTAGCHPVAARSDAVPEATTTAGEGSIIFTDGEICATNRIIIESIVAIPTPCAGECDGQIVVTAVTGDQENQDVFVRLENPFSTAFSGDTLDNVCAGWNYFDLFTDDGELVTSDSVFVDVDLSGAATADAGEDRTLSCGASNAFISGNGNVGEEYLLYRLNPDGDLILVPGGSGTIDGGNFSYATTSGGTYVLEVFSAAGCSALDTVEVTDPVLPVAVAGNDTTLTCDVNSIVLTGAGSSTEEPVTYLWEQIVEGQPVDTLGTNLTVTIDSAGRYRLTVFFPVSQCSATDVIIVNDERTPPNVNIPANVSLACDGSPALLDAETGEPNQSYVWTNSGGGVVAIEPTFTTSLLETFTVTVTDTLTNCATSVAVTVTESQGNPIISDTLDQPLNCGSDTIRLSPSFANLSGNETYSWTTTDGDFVIGENNDPDPQVIGMGTYTLVVDDAGCSSTATIEVVMPVPPVADAGADANIECGQTLTITGSASQVSDPGFLWFTAGDTINGEITNTLTVDAPGLYVLEVRDPNTNCRATDTVEILPAIGFPMVTLADTIFGFTCDPVGLTIDPQIETAGDPATVSISGPGNPVINPDNTFTLFAAGNFVLTVTNDANGCTADFPFLVDDTNVELPFAALTVSTTTITCVDPVVPLSGVLSTSGPNITYEWNNVIGGETPATQGNDTLLVGTAGTYELTVINTDNLCRSRDSILVIDGRVFPEAEALPFDPIDCSDITTTLSVDIPDTSGLFIQWFGQPMGDPPSALFAENVLTVDVSGPANYSVVVIELESSCVTTVTFPVELDDGGINNIQFEPVDTFSCSSSAVTIDASGSLVDATGIGIEWSSLEGNTITPASGSLIVSVDGAGSYVLTLSSGEECTSSDTIFVAAAADTPFADAGPDLEVECGEMPMLEGQNSTPAPLTDTIVYVWTGLNGGSIVSDGDGPTPTVSGPGTYVLEITNLTNLCSATDTVRVTLIGQEAAALPNDFAVCGDTATVMGNLPAGTTGDWEIINQGGAQVDFFDTEASISGLSNPVTLSWILSAPGCENYSADTITISQAAAPVAVNDQFNIVGNNGVGTLNLLDNDQPNGPVTVTLLDTVPFGSIISFFNGELTLDAGQGASGSFELRYEICSDACGVCDQASVTVRVDADGQQPPTYNAITPNGDGLNEFLVFDLLEFNPEDYPDNSIIIFNRWGDILYEAEPYNNDWDGRNQSGGELPEGTYYYILRLSLGEGDIIRGDVTILR